MIDALRTALFISVLAPMTLFAAPNSKQAAEFVDYYFHGQGQTPILAKMKTCHQVGLHGEKEHHCLGDYTGYEMNPSETVVVWMQFAAPEGTQTEDLQLEMSLADKVIETMPLSIEGSIRYRTYKAFKPEQSGHWMAKVYYTKDEKKLLLGEMKIRVGQKLAPKKL